MILILTPGERFWLMSWRSGWTRRELAEMYSPTGLPLLVGAEAVSARQGPAREVPNS